MLEIHLGEPLPLIQYVHFLPTNYLWLFMAGVLVRMLAERLSDRPVSRLRAPLLAALTLVSALLLLNTGLKINFLDQLLLEMGTWGTIVFMDLVVVVFFATAVLGSPLLRGLLSWRFFGFVGVMSYSLFLLHQMVNMTAAKYLLGDIGSWAENRGVLAIWAAFSAYVLGVLLVAGAISYLSYRFIESPFLRIKPK